MRNPEDPQEIADLLDEMLSDDSELECWSRNGQKRLHTEFLVFAQMQRRLRVLTDCASAPRQKATAGQGRR